MMKRKIRIEPDPRGNELQAASVSSSARGFTLVETMAVVAVGAILATIAIPAYRDWMTHSAVNNAAATVMAHLKQARNMAMAENRNITVSFDFPAAKFTYDVGVPPNQKNQVIDLKQFSNSLMTKYKQNTINLVFTSSGRLKEKINGKVSEKVIQPTMKILERNYYQCITINIIGRPYMTSVNQKPSATCQAL